MTVGLSTRGYVSPGSGAGGDLTPPVITIISPTPDVDPGGAGGFDADWEIARVTPIILEIADADPGNLYQCLVCRYANDSIERVVFRRAAFRGEFHGPSAIVSDDGFTIRLSIIPVGGWPSIDAISDIVFDIDAIDSNGNLAA